MCSISDMLNEVASLKDYPTTTNKRPRGPTEGPKRPQQFSMKHLTAEYPSNDTALPAFSSVPSDPNTTISGTASVMSNNWDLSNLLLMQMGYTVPGYDSENHDGQQVKATAPLHDPGAIWVPGVTDVDINSGFGQIIHSGYTGEPNPNTDEGFSLWSDMPATFHRYILSFPEFCSRAKLLFSSIDEWDKYLAHVNRNF
jgi:hypothetical protein